MPTDPNSRFVVVINPISGQPTRQNITFSPLVSGRVYTVTTRTDLVTSSWQPLSSSTSQDTGAQRTVTDFNAGPGRRFYRVEIARP